MVVVSKEVRNAFKHCLFVGDDKAFSHQPIFDLRIFQISYHVVFNSPLLLQPPQSTTTIMTTTTTTQDFFITVAGLGLVTRQTCLKPSVCFFFFFLYKFKFSTNSLFKIRMSYNNNERPPQLNHQDGPHPTPTHHRIPDSQYPKRSPQLVEHANRAVLATTQQPW